MNQKKGSNAGFSLVELIAIMAIMIVFAVGAIWGFNNTGSYRTKSAANVINSYLDSTQNDCMTTNTAYLTISNGKAGEDDGYYYVSNTVLSKDATGKYAPTPSGQEERLNSNIVISYDYKDGENYVTNTLEAGQSLMITYDRSSGALKPIISGFNDENGAPVYATDSSDNEIYCSHIYVTGGGCQKTIKIYPKTGKHEVFDSSASLEEDDEQD